MARTVTIRVWTLLALILVSSGGTLFAVGMQESEPYRPDVESIAVVPANGEPASVVNSSALPRKQRGVFLLAVEPAGFDEFHTTDPKLKAALNELPDAVRYNGTVYEIHENPGGGADYVTYPIKEWAGSVLVVIGIILFVALEVPTYGNEES